MSRPGENTSEERNDSLTQNPKPYVSEDTFGVLGFTFRCAITMPASTAISGRSAYLIACGRLFAFLWMRVSARGAVCVLKLVSLFISNYNTACVVLSVAEFLLCFASNNREE